MMFTKQSTKVKIKEVVLEKVLLRKVFVKQLNRVITLLSNIVHVQY